MITAARESVCYKMRMELLAPMSRWSGSCSREMVSGEEREEEKEEEERKKEEEREEEGEEGDASIPNPDTFFGPRLFPLTPCLIPSNSYRWSPG